MSDPTLPPPEGNPYHPPAGDVPGAVPPPPPPPAPPAYGAPAPPAPPSYASAPPPAYAPPPAAYGAPAYAPAQYAAPPTTNGMAIASLVLGILGIISCGYTFFVAPILAIVFGVIGRRQIRERGQGGNGLAVTGLILGVVGLVISVAITAFVIIAIMSSPSTTRYGG